MFLYSLLIFPFIFQTDDVAFPFMCQNVKENVFIDMKAIVEKTMDNIPLVVGEPIPKKNPTKKVSVASLECHDENVAMLDEDETVVQDIDGRSRVSVHHSEFAKQIINETETATRNIQFDSMKIENTKKQSHSCSIQKKMKELQKMVEDDDDAKEHLDELLSCCIESLVGKMQEKQKEKYENETDEKKRKSDDVATDNDPSWGFTVLSKRHKNHRHKKHWEK